MRTLIVGGCGYLGGAVTDLLPDCIVYDNLLYEHEYRKNRQFVQGDIRDREKLKPLLDNADAVIWLAGIVGDGACAHNPDLTYEINTESVKWLSENFHGRIVFPSTCSVYGAQDGLLNESSPTNPLSVYASSKLDAEQYLLGKNAVIFRLGTVFGVSDEYSRLRLDLVVNTMTAKAYTDGKLKVFGGEQYRPLIHVKQIASEMVKALSTQEKGIRNLANFNYKMSELAEVVADYTDSEIETVDIKFEDARNYRIEHLMNDDLPHYTVPYAIGELLEVLPRIKDPQSPRYSNANYLGELWK